MKRIFLIKATAEGEIAMQDKDGVGGNNTYEQV